MKTSAVIFALVVGSCHAKELVTGGYRVSLAQRRALAAAGIGYSYGTPYASSAPVPVAAPAAVSAPVAQAAPTVIARSVQYETRVYHLPIASHRQAYASAPLVAAPAHPIAAVAAPVAGNSFQYNTHTVHSGAIATVGVPLGHGDKVSAYGSY